MNWLDIVLLVVLSLHVMNGFSRGLMKQLFDIIGFVVIIVLSFIGGRMFSESLARYINPEDIIPHHDVIRDLGLEVALEKAPQFIAAIIAFLVLFLFLSLVFRIFSGGFRWVNRIPVIGLFNRIGGAALGVVVGVVFVYIIIAAISLIPMQIFIDALAESEAVFISRQYLTPLAEQLKELVIKVFIDLNGLRPEQNGLNNLNGLEG